MQITIENCSSPGASFTENTNKVILSCYEWITQNNGVIKSFIDFRKEVSREKHFNDNNARNIYPLLKNAGLVNYEKGSLLQYDSFFTNLGVAYAKALETEKMIDMSDYSKHQKTEALKEIQQIKANIVFMGLKNLLKTDCNYKSEMKEMINFIIRFGKISKQEFAYLLFFINSSTQENKMPIEEFVEKIRSEAFSLVVNVDVRNDIDLRERSGNKRRKEGLSYLTSFSYFSSLLEQAGLVIKNAGFIKVKAGEIDKLNELMEV